MSGVGHSPSSDRPSSGRAAGARCPVFFRRGVCGRAGLSPTPQRTLLRAAVARYGGGTRPPVDRGLVPLCPRLGTRPPPTSRPWSAVAGARCPFFLGARGLRAWGSVSNPTAHAAASWCCAPWRRQEGSRGGGGGVPGASVRVARGWALSVCQPPSLGRAARAGCPFSLGAGGAGVGGCHQPHSTRPCELALRAVGAARGRPGGGGASFLHERRLALGTLPPRIACHSGAWPGPAARFRCAGGPRVLGSVTNPRAYVLASWHCALWGCQEGAPEGAPLASVRGVQGLVCFLPRPSVLRACPGLAARFLRARGVRPRGPSPTA